MKSLRGAGVCVVLGAFLALGCDDGGGTPKVSPPGTSGGASGNAGSGNVACEDKDGDGFCGLLYATEQDCDDDDPAIYPRATETCNAKDDDCDGVIDNGATAACQFTCEAPTGGCETMTAISAGSRHVCALSSSGGVYCWGSNTSGGLGIPDLSNSTLPVAVPGVSGATALAGSSTVTCALAGSEALCWGAGSALPFAIPLDPSTKQIALTDATIYALLADGSVQSRALLPTTAAPAVFVAVTQTAQQAISASGSVFCMLDAAGALHCPAPSDKAKAIDATGVTMANVTLDGSVCYTQAGALHCVDTNGSDQVIAGNGSAVGVAKSTAYGCAFAASGKVACWTAGPTMITDAQQLAIGGSFGCVLRKNGKVSCWGSRDNGALGDGTVGSGQEAEPIDVQPTAGFALKGAVLLRTPALGACDSVSDVAFTTTHYGTGAVHALFKSCATKCQNTLDSAACFADCAKNPGLSAECFGCFAGLASCTGPSCYAAFTGCAGFPIDFLPVARNAPRFECVGAACMKGAQLAADCKEAAECLSGACDTLPQSPDHSVCVTTDGASCDGSTAFCACDFGDPSFGYGYFGHCGGCYAPGRIGSAAGDCFRDCTNLNYCEVGQKCEFFSDYRQKHCN